VWVGIAVTALGVRRWNNTGCGTRTASNYISYTCHAPLELFKIIIR
jgi:hypothetical protein